MEPVPLNHAAGRETQPVSGVSWRVRTQRLVTDHARAIALSVAALLGAVLGAAQWQFLVSNTLRWTESDATVIWYATRELSIGRLHQPNFYGESYFTVFEALPAKLLVVLGVPVNVAAPVATTVLMLGLWVVLAVGAWLGRRRVSACVALAIPLVMCDEYLAAVTQPGGRAAGTLLASAGLALLIFRPASLRFVGAAALLGGIGTAFDPGAALFTGPALVYAIAVNRDRLRRTLLVAAVALAPTAVWLVFITMFYAVHPADNFFPHASNPSAAVLATNLTHIDWFFTYLAPEVARVGAAPLAVTAALIARLVWLRTAATVSTAIAAVVVVLLALSAAGAGGTASPYFAYSRYLFDFPVLVWLLVAAGERPAAAARPSLAPYLVAGVAVLALVSSGYRAADLTARLAGLNRLSTLDTPDQVTPVQALLSDCGALAAVVKRTGIDVIIFPGLDSADAYGCGAVDYGRYETLLPAFDRRTWLMVREATVPRTAFLVTSVPSSWCAGAVAAGAQSCALDPIDPGVAVVRMRRTPVLVLWNQMAQPVRCPFGPASSCIP